MKKRYVWFRFQPSDYKAAQQILEDWRDRGWELEKILWPGIAVLVPLSRPGIRYAVDVTRTETGMEGGPEEAEDYLTLCADAGWDRMGCTGKLQVFKSAPGREPAPLQSDRLLEEGHLRRNVLQPMLWAVLAPLLSMGLYALLQKLTGEVHYWFGAFLEKRSLALLAALVLLVAWHLYLAVSVRRYGKKCRRALEEDCPLPIPSAAGAMLRGILSCAVWLILLGTLGVSLIVGDNKAEAPLDPARLAAEDRPVVTAAHLGGGNRPDDVMWLREGYGLRSVELLQILKGGGVLLVERYDAAWPWLAHMTCRELRSQADRDRTRAIVCGKEPGRPVEVEVPGVDEAVLLAYERGEYLLLRSGNTVVRLAADLDFTDGDILAIIVSQMKLGA